MGKKAKLKQREEQEQQQRFLAEFARNSKIAAAKKEETPLLDAFAGYEQLFIKPPEQFVLRTRSDRREKQLLEMARHLFGVYRVPRFLEQVWAQYEPKVVYDSQGRRNVYMQRGQPQARIIPVNINLREVDFRKWYICVAQGGSLYKQHTKNILTKKETHMFVSAPENLEISQGLVWAIARCAGADNGQALRLARSKLSERRLSEFWMDVIRWFCLEGNVPTSVNQVNDLVDYLARRHNEDRNMRILGSGWSLAAMLRRMEEWHRALARAKDLSGAVWDGMPLDDWSIRTKDPNHADRELVWTFRQIKTGKELAEEGTAMRHCVYSYKTRCSAGLCSIWSLTKANEFGKVERRLTIELDQNGRIAQKRGLANRQPRPDEEAVVQRWVKEAGLINGYY